MPEKIITTDPPSPREEDFEEFLATDDLFLDYFNHYLQLPSFPEPLRFNPDSGGFEVLSPARHQIADKIKALSRAQTPKSSVYKNAIAKPPMRLPYYENEVKDNDEEEIKTSFSVKCLDKEQGIQWIKENRLPTFLQSDLYMEYRLAKLLSQIETSRSGIKLTVDQNYRPWFKPKPTIRPPTPVDEEAELIQLLKVTMGSMSTSQSKEWFSVAKQVEGTSVTSANAFSRPLSSVVTATPRTPRRHESSSRPISVQSFRTDVADDADEYFSSIVDDKTEASSFKKQYSSGSSVIISSTMSSNIPFRDEEAARVVPEPIKARTKVGRVVRIDPQVSDDDSDQGVGSESDETIEEVIEEEEQGKSYSFEMNDIESYASVLVSLIIKKAFQTLSPNLGSTRIDHVANLDAIVPRSPRGTLLSRLDSKMYSEAIMEHEERVLEEQEAFSMQSIREIRSASTKTSVDVTIRTESPMKKSITFKKTVASKLDEETDSVFSDETDELESIVSGKRSVFSDVKDFDKFRRFLSKTVGEKLMSLWMDIDKTRFAIRKNKMQSFLQRIREAYLKVGSTKRLPNEILQKYKLLHATQWTVKHLHKVQRELSEPLLLYWAPRYLVRQGHVISKHPEALSLEETASLNLRPTSSQSYPSPKTITILPLRPRSCLPRIKQGKVPNTKQGHVVSEYHQYSEPDVYLKRHDPSPTLTTPSPIPSYLQTKVTEISNRQDENLLPRRPASAGPLTRQTRARFERRKSAAAKTREQKLRARLVRPVTSPPTSVSSDATVKGSPAMESMLQALYHDTRAGWFFTQFCESSNNALWSNSVHFWFDVQEYHYLFYRDIIDQFSIERKSQTIYSSYIVAGANEDIGVSVASKKQIRLTLNPPFEELFDAAEEYVLKVLIVPWNKMLGMDKASYSRVELIEQERRLNVAAKYMGCLKKKGILKEKRTTIPTEQESIQKYEEDLWEKVPEEFQDYSFDQLVRNRIELDHFRKFLEENYVKTDLICWLDIESFKRLPHQANEKRDEKAKDIKDKYLQKKYFFGPNSPATKDEQSEAVKASGGWSKTLKDRPPTELIVEVQRFVKRRIEKRWLPLFLATKEFQERQRPRSQMAEVAEDVVLQKKKKRGEPWKLLDSRWQSSTRDLMEFRRALANPVTAGQFRRYVSLKGEFLENDVLFWLEVQKYKDFCHIHNDTSSIESKVISIINCFINSQIPPALQIDISSEMADKLLDKRKEMGPYVFREAQLTVFRILFPHWSGFCDFRKTLSNEKLTTTLERQRRRKMERTRLQMKEQEKEEARREELRALKDAETFDLPDIASMKGSDVATESLHSVSRTGGVQMSWSYGKYIDNLEQQRMLLLMENEVKGRVPLEAMDDPDYDVSSEDGDESSDTDDGKSLSSDDATLSLSGKKRRKEKIIHSTIKPVSNSDTKSVHDDVINGASKQTRLSDSSKRQHVTSRRGKDVIISPAVTVD